MRFAKTSLAVSVSLALTACGGGGGGGGALGTPSNPYLRSSVPYYTPTSAGTYQVFAGGSGGAAVLDVFKQDLNKDNIDEVVIGGRMSQPKTVATWQNTNLQIFGWNAGSFRNETSTWFSGNDNQVLGTEPSIKFADFNGDGNIDMFVAPSTDMSHYGNGLVYFNSGSNSLTKTTLALSDVWGHDSVVKDLNGDGYADIMIASLNTNTMTVSFGSAAGTFTTYQAAAGSGTTGASGISVADYLGNGTQTIVLTDASATGNQDTKLYSWSVTSGNVVLTEVAALPASRFYLSKWNSARAATAVAPHEIRNMTFDFNNDGRSDVVVISTLPNSGNDKPYTEVQFLRNDGSGIFTDVTDSMLVGFNTTSSPSYQPILMDVNKDGLVDIILPAQDSVGSSQYTSGRVLLATSDGKFVSSYESVFRDFWNQISSTTSGANTAWGQSINIVQGPNGDLYLVGSVLSDGSTTTKATVYAARIGSNGTTSVQATADAINSIWPFLTGTDTNEVLARTATSFVNGIAIIDWANVWNPVGGLGITLDGRTGRRIMLAGSISVPGMDRNLLSNLQAVDAIGRDFTVDMSSMSSQPGFMPITYSLADTTDVTRNWSSRFVDEDRRDWKGFSFSGQDVTRFSTSISNRHFGDTGPITYRLGMTKMPGSPWFNFNGVFGSPESSTIFDFTATRTWSTGWFAQGGVMQTSTELNQGLVQDVTPLWAGYAVMGFQNSEWTAYAGLQPTVFAGHMDMKLPTSVDRAGIMHYTNKTVEIRNQAIGFVGLERRWENKSSTWKFSSVVNDQGQYQARFTYGYRF